MKNWRKFTKEKIININTEINNGYMYPGRAKAPVYISNELVPKEMKIGETYFLTSEFFEGKKCLLNHPVVLKKFISAKIKFPKTRGSAAVLYDKNKNEYIVHPEAFLYRQKVEENV